MAPTARARGARAAAVDSGTRTDDAAAGGARALHAEGAAGSSDAGLVGANAGDAGGSSRGDGGHTAAAATGASASDAWAASLAQLAAPTTNLRSEALDQITLLLQEADWRLVGVGAPELVEALRARLSDSNWSVSQKCLLLIGDLVSDADEEVDVLVR